MDRARLQTVIANVRRNETVPGNQTVVHKDDLLALRKAAEAHLATLPKTKMVEVWRVEYAACIGGTWFPECAARNTREQAETFVLALPHDSMARVTGPHQQEVPA